MNNILLIGIIFTIVQIANCQESDTINQFDDNGLKIGYWKLDQIFQGEELSNEGRFIVIPLDTSMDYSKDIEGSVFLHFEKNKQTLEYAGKTDTLISVKDGEWISYRKYPGENTKIAQIEYFNKGYHYKTRRTPPLNNHELFSDYTKVFVVTDSSKRSDIYLGNDTVVVESYEKRKYTYYPNNYLEVNDIVLSLNSLFTLPDTAYLKINARNCVSIDSITTPNKNISFILPNNNDQSNYQLETNQKDSIGVIYKPNRNDLERKTYMTIHASDGNYKIFFWLYAHDISWRNITKVDSIALKKDNNLKLYVQRMSNHMYYALFDYELEEYDYLDISRGKGALKTGNSLDTGTTGPLEISDLKIGTYYLVITGEEIEKIMKLIIE